MTDADLLERIPNLSALVAGDICLDYRCAYDDSLSIDPRTGNSRIAVVAADVRPGLAGGIAADVAALGCGRIAVLGVAGLDGHGFELQNAFRDRGISVENLIRTRDCSTWTQMRFVNSRNGAEDHRPVEFLSTRKLPETLQRQIVNRYQSIFDGFNIVYIADHAADEQGAITAPLRKMVDDFAPAYPDKIVIVDSRVNLLHYRRVILMLDRQEAEAISIDLLGRVDFPGLRDRLRARLLVLTLDGQGVAVYDSRGPVNVPPAHSIPSGGRDVSGAFRAAFGLVLAMTRDVYRATEFGNLVAAITAMKRTGGVARPHEILHGAR